LYVINKGKKIKGLLYGIYYLTYGLPVRYAQTGGLTKDARCTPHNFYRVNTEGGKDYEIFKTRSSGD